MLKAFEYGDVVELTQSNKSPTILREELKIAKEVVGEIQAFHSLADVSGKCPVCGQGNEYVLYKKWGVSYFLCHSCKSIYCSCDEKTRNTYINNQTLIDFRKSVAYQQDGGCKRSESWDETVRWLRFRSFRYLAGKKRLSVIDIGNRYLEFSNRIRNAEFCEFYNLRNSILQKVDELGINRADMVLYINILQQETKPEEKLCQIRDLLKEDGLLVIGTRAGSGFDILVLQEAHEHIFPYEHITLPSVDGLIALLERTGYKVLEVTTPGVMDVNYVNSHRELIKDSNLFVKTMMIEKSEQALMEFQHFLQKNCMSSYVQIIAMRV